MESDTGPLTTFLRGMTEGLETWIASLSPQQLVLAAIFVLLVFALRVRLSGWGLAALQALLRRFSVVLPEEVGAQLQTAFAILLVTLSVYISGEALQLGGPAKLFFERILGSVAIIAVFGAWFQLSGPFASLLRNEKTRLVSTEVDWIERTTRFAILLFGLTSLFKVWQIDISGALTGVGVLGAGLAIATQDLIRNLVAGMTNISEKRFETGDAIQVEGQFLGTVERIDLRSTLVVGFDQIPRHIPNSDLSNSVVLNYSARKHRRVMMKVPLVLESTQEQIEAVRDGLRDYHRTSGDFALDDGAPDYVYVSEIGPSSVDILIYVWTVGADYEEYLRVTERLSLAILGIVRQAGTRLAYPTQTVHLETGAPAGMRAGGGPGPEPEA